MNYNIISKDEVLDAYKLVLSIDDCDKEIQFSLDFIMKEIQKSNIAKVPIRIPMWGAYEVGKIEISDVDFIKMLFPEQYSMHGKIFILTDECFFKKDGFGIEINVAEMFNFPNIYKKEFGAKFFNGSDITFILKDMKRIAYLDHEGYILPI